VRAFRVGSAFLDHRNLAVQAYPFLKRLMESSVRRRTRGHRRRRGSVRRTGAVPRADANVGEARRTRATARVRCRQGDALRDGRLPQYPRRSPGAASPVTRSRRSRRATRSRELAAGERGYAIDDEEHAEGLFCVAAPVWDENGEPWAAISLAGPTSRLLPAHVPELGRLVRTVAGELTVALGGQPRQQ
jgi:IclR family acetate operon transcriptional repressor